MKTVLMIMGDLDYGSVLPTSSVKEHQNISYQHAVLRSEYGEFTFVNNSLSSIADHEHELAGCPNATSEVPDSLNFPTLSYVLFICFALLMPIVVLNTLVCFCSWPFALVTCDLSSDLVCCLQIGLAVGDIAAVQEQAALRQIRMQVEDRSDHSAYL